MNKMKVGGILVGISLFHLLILSWNYAYNIFGDYPSPLDFIGTGILGNLPFFVLFFGWMVAFAKDKEKKEHDKRKTNKT